VPNRRKGLEGQCRSSIVQRAELALPGERVGHDGGKIVELRLPPEQFAGAVGIRHDLRRVAGPRAGALDPKIDAGHALDGGSTGQWSASLAFRLIATLRAPIAAAGYQPQEQFGVQATAQKDLAQVA